jgi:UDP-N-acetylmuramoylalanine--D-glutamate ligase
LAQNKSIPIQHEMTLFFDRSPSKIIGITGTRGKSTTTALIAHILEAYPKKVWLGGNIAKGSPLDFLDKLQKDDLVVLELSNFMLEYLDLHKQSPDIAVLLNVLPDHLDRYDGDMNAYASSKEVITKYQDEKDILIVNRENKYTRIIGDQTNAGRIWYSRFNELDSGYFLQGSMLIERQGGQETELLDINQIPLRGAHNHDNVLAAVACIRQLYDDPKPLQEHIGSFPTLKGRLQFIDEFNGITFVNDTTSTTPVSTAAAIDSLDSRAVVLIAGGNDKGLPLEGLSQKLNSVKSIVWLPGTGTDRMLTEFPIDRAQKANDMSEAVKLAFSRAEKGDVILLSPGFTSFGLFKNEYDRGDQFDQSVKELIVNASV